MKSDTPATQVSEPVLGAEVVKDIPVRQQAATGSNPMVAPNAPAAANQKAGGKLDQVLQEVNQAVKDSSAKPKKEKPPKKPSGNGSPKPVLAILAALAVTVLLIVAAVMALGNSA